MQRHANWQLDSVLSPGIDPTRDQHDVQYLSVFVSMLFTFVGICQYVVLPQVSAGMAVHNTAFCQIWLRR